ncbi:hypothetical protein JCM10295v2_006364 [Rhodotorula toruloides]
MRTTPFSATIKELLELVPYVEEFTVVDEEVYPRTNSIVEKSIVAALASFTGWKSTLRSLSMPRLQDETFSSILEKPKLQSLRLQMASSKYPLPTGSTPQLATRVDVPVGAFLLPLLADRTRPNCRHLMVDFALSTTTDRPLQWCQDKRHDLKLFLSDNEQLQTFVLNHSYGRPAAGQVTHRRSSSLTSSKRGLETGDWPPTLKEFVWTSKNEVSDEEKAEVVKL